MNGMEKIKVVHVITRFDKGGSAENTFLTLRGLDKRKYEVILVKGLSNESYMGTAESRAIEEGLKELQREGVRIRTIPALIRKIQPLSDFHALVDLIKIFREERPHIVHTHTSKAGILGRWAAFVTGVPIIVHTPHGHVFWGYFNTYITLIYIFLEKLTARITDKIIALTEREKRDHLKYNIAREYKFSVIHSGVDLRKFLNATQNSAEVKAKLGIAKESFVIGTVGRLTHIKGHRYLIEAATKIVSARKNMVFVILGDGELWTSLRMMALNQGINEKVLFLGWRSDVAEIISTFDVFVLPSLNEGMGRVLVEAMAIGKPIVASDVGGIPDLIIHGKNGFLVPPADSEALAMAIMELYRNPTLRINMGQQGKAMSVSFSVESMIQKIDQLYTDLFKNLSSRSFPF